MPFVVMSVSKVNTRTLQILGDVHQWKRSVCISCIFFHDELLLSWDVLHLFFVQVLCKLATHYINVHSRQCIDEAEVVEHLVGLTSSLAKCKFRQVTFTQTSSVTLLVFSSESRNCDALQFFPLCLTVMYGHCFVLSLSPLLSCCFVGTYIVVAKIKVDVLIENLYSL